MVRLDIADRLHAAARHGGSAMSHIELQRAVRAVVRSVGVRSARGREAIFGASLHLRRLLCVRVCVFITSTTCMITSEVISMVITIQITVIPTNTS